MQKSSVINLKIAFSRIGIPNDYDYYPSDISDSLNFEEEDSGNEYANLDQFQSLFQDSEYNEIIPACKNNAEIGDYEHMILSKEFEAQTIKCTHRSHVECVYSLVSSMENFPKSESSYEQMSPPIYMWKYTTKLIHSKFPEYVQSYFRENYTKIYPRLRFLCKVFANDDKMKEILSIRKVEIPKERILFHHIGYGFPPMEQTSIVCYDEKTGIYSKYPIADLFKSVQTPSFFVFDCDNAGLALYSLQIASKSCSKSVINSLLVQKQLKTIDWNDYYCICATDINESLPTCQYLPRDFLTSCIFTPVKIAIICHILQYYRTSLVTDKFPFDRYTETSEYENANLNNSLQAIIDAIAVESLNTKLYRELFRADAIIATLFRQFILAQFLLRPYQVHPVSKPVLPDLSYHFLWNDWKNIVDSFVTRLTADSFGFINNIFYNSIDSITEQLKNNSESNITQGLISLIFHIPNIDSDLTSLSYRLLAEYASKSQECRNILAKTVLFPFLFSNLLQNNLSKDSTHYLLFLCVSVLQTNPNLINEINPKDSLLNLTDLFYNKETPNITKTLTAAVLSMVISVNNEMLHFLINSRKNLLQLKELLEEPDSLLNLWTLILLNRVFDYNGVDKAVYELGIHLQIGLFCFHNSHEIRAAALSVLPFFIHSNVNITVQLFLLSFQTSLDLSFFVRYNYALFLNKLASITNKNIELKDIEGKRNNLNLLINKYICEDFSEITSKGKIIQYINKFIKEKEPIDIIFEFLLSLFDFYHYDPHPSIRKCIDQILNQSEEVSDNGGGAILKTSLYHLVNYGHWKCENKKDSFIKPISLPPPSLTTIPTTKLVKTIKYKFDSEIATHLSYDSKTLSISLSTSKGNVYYFDENYENKSKLYIDSRITAHSISEWEYQPLIFIGTNDGCIHVWNPSNSKQKICFRNDLEDNSDLPTVLALFSSKKQFVSARGKSSKVRLWDVEYQKLVGEWKVGARGTVTAIATHPHSSDLCVAGFSNGLIVEMDLRSNELHNINAPIPNEKIIKIVGNVRNGNSVSFIAGTRNSSCILWEDLYQCSILKLDKDSLLNDFDAHQHSPLIALSTSNSFPVLTDYNGSIIHSIKEAGTDAVCSFHPVLPNIMFGSTTGELIEYQLTT